MPLVRYLDPVTLDRFLALLPIVASIALTAWNLWFQQRQEKERAKRSAQERLAEREANRSDRLHEHWLDRRIEVYRQFLSRTSEAQTLIVEEFKPRSGHATPAPSSTGVIREARELLDELTLVASSEVSQAASEYFSAATGTLDMIHRELALALALGGETSIKELEARTTDNLATIVRERDRFRNLVRAELGLGAIASSPATSDVSQTHIG